MKIWNIKILLCLKCTGKLNFLYLFWLKIVGINSMQTMIKLERWKLQRWLTIYRTRFAETYIIQTAFLLYEIKNRQNQALLKHYIMKS